MGKHAQFPTALEHVALAANFVVRLLSVALQRHLSRTVPCSFAPTVIFFFFIMLVPLIRCQHKRQVPLESQLVHRWDELIPVGISPVPDVIAQLAVLGGVVEASE